MKTSLVLMVVAGACGQLVVAQESVRFDLTEVALDGAGIGADFPRLEFVDVDGDGQLDMARGLRYRLRTGAASFGAELTAGENGFFADVDSDGDQDVVIGDDRGGGDATRVDLVWRERNASGEYLADAVLTLPPATRDGGGAIAGIRRVRFSVEDLNGDGVNDIARSIEASSGLSVTDYIGRAASGRGAVVLAKQEVSAGAGNDLAEVGVGPDLDGDGWPSVYLEEIDYGLGSDGLIVERYYPNSAGVFGPEAFDVVVGAIDNFDVFYQGVVVPGDDGGLPYVVLLQTDYFDFPNDTSTVGFVSRMVGEAGSYTTQSVGTLEVEGLPPSHQIGTIGARTRFGGNSRLDVSFDPDQDGDTDLLLELEFRRAFSNVTQRFTSVFVNQGDGDFVARFMPRVSIGGGALAQTFYRDGDFGEVLGDPDDDGVYEVLHNDGARFRWLDVSLEASGDLNDDGVVGVSDLALLLSHIGQRSASHDLDRDGVVDARDVAMLLASWGATPE